VIFLEIKVKYVVNARPDCHTSNHTVMLSLLTVILRPLTVILSLSKGAQLKATNNNLQKIKACMQKALHSALRQAQDDSKWAKDDVMKLRMTTRLLKVLI